MRPRHARTMLEARPSRARPYSALGGLAALHRETGGGEIAIVIEQPDVETVRIGRNLDLKGEIVRDQRSIGQCQIAHNRVALPVYDEIGNIAGRIPVRN